MACAGNEFISQRKAKAEAAEAEGKADKPTESPMEQWTQAEFVRVHPSPLPLVAH